MPAPKKGLKICKHGAVNTLVPIFNFFIKHGNIIPKLIINSSYAGMVTLDMNTSLNAFLSSEPDRIVNNIPVTTNNIILPFDALSWENFEKFCFQLGCKEMDCLDSSYIYGRRGQKQDGIDLYFKTHNETIVWQIKRYASFTANDVKKAVNSFIQGKWLEKTNAFILCVSCSLDDVVLVDEIDAQSNILDKHHIRFGILNANKLTSMAERYPEIIEKFFGKARSRVFENSENEKTNNNTDSWYFGDGSKVDNKKIYSVGDISAKITNDTIYAEHKMADGHSMYAEFDAKNPGVIKKSKFPYPLSEYQWDIPSHLVLSENKGMTVIEGKEYFVIVTDLKWDRKIYRFFDKDKLVDMTINSPVTIDNTNKVIHIKETH